MVLIKAVVKRPNEDSEIVEIENSLESLQSIVGGWIERVPSIFNPKYDLYCNEEGKLMGLPPNIITRGTDVVVGTVVVVSSNSKGATIGLEQGDAERIKIILDALGKLV